MYRDARFTFDPHILCGMMSARALLCTLNWHNRARKNPGLSMMPVRHHVFMTCDHCNLLTDGLAFIFHISSVASMKRKRKVLSIEAKLAILESSKGIIRPDCLCGMKLENIKKSELKPKE